MCAEPDVLDVVESLLDKSLVRRAGEDLDGDARFTMLMSLREYAAEQLEEQAEVQATRDRHAAWFAARAREWEATVGTAAETDTWPQLAAFRADLERAPWRTPAAADDGELIALAGRGAGLVRLHPRRPGRGQCRWASWSLPPTTNGPTRTPGPRDGWRPGSRRYGLGRLELAAELLGPFRAADGRARGAPGRRGARLPRAPRPGAR